MKGISLWIEFLIYTAFALSILSFVIYFVHLTIQNQQDELNLKYIVNLLTNLNYQIETIGSCYSCNYKAYDNLPFKNNHIYLSGRNNVYILFYYKLFFTSSSIYKFKYNSIICI